MLPLQGVWVQPLVGKLRSHMPWSFYWLLGQLVCVVICSDSSFLVSQAPESPPLSVTHLCFSSLPQTTFFRQRGIRQASRFCDSHSFPSNNSDWGLTELHQNLPFLSFFFCHLILKFVAWICNHIIVYVVWVSCFCYCSFCWFLHNFCRGRVYALAFLKFSPSLYFFEDLYDHLSYIWSNQSVSQDFGAQTKKFLSLPQDVTRQCG